MAQPKFLVIAGDGINCERETAKAFVLAGGESQILHVNEVAADPKLLTRFDGLAIPGGFSFGDELGSGQIMALKIRHKLGDAFFDFVAAKKPVIGICNGFQVLVKLGLLPYPATLERVMALAPNEQGGFTDRWVTLDTVPNAVCQWTQGLTSFELPIRHGEGRIVFNDAKIYDILLKSGQVALTYRDDVNGSHGKIAGLCDATGRVFGLMPHPEAFVYQATYRVPQRDFTAGGAGQKLFKNIINLLSGKEVTKAYASGNN
jgi:phosphoribosylformylglycinamidine synthase